MKGLLPAACFSSVGRGAAVGTAVGINGRLLLPTAPRYHPACLPADPGMAFVCQIARGDAGAAGAAGAAEGAAAAAGSAAAAEGAAGQAAAVAAAAQGRCKAQAGAAAARAHAGSHARAWACGLTHGRWGG